MDGTIFTNSLIQKEEVGVGSGGRTHDSCLFPIDQYFERDADPLLPLALDLKGSPVIWRTPLLLFPHLDLGYSQRGRGTHAIVFHGSIEVRH